MAKFELRFESEDGYEELELVEGRYTFGRGSEAEYRFEDDGLSRIHATIYCEDDNVWIVDENSSNGTFVNGSKVGSSGTPLSDGDSIKIGHYTNIAFSEISTDQSDSGGNSAIIQTEVSTDGEKPPLLIPVAVLGLAFLMIIGAFGIIGFAVYYNSSPTVARNNPPPRSFEDRYPEEGLESSPNTDSTQPPTTPGTGGDPNPETPNGDPLDQDPTPSGTPYPELPQKLYSKMSESEKNLYIKIKGEKVARLIGNKNTGDIPPAAVSAIRRFVEQYANRFRSTRVNNCLTSGFTRSDMQTILERASKNVPFITRSFRSQAVDPQVGIYVAMIESEHCVCLQSPTGPLGMFQFTRATGKNFGLDTRRGATPQNPDERCEPGPAAKASAKYLKYLSGRIGTGPLSIPLAIASYNSGEGGLGRNLMTALSSKKGDKRSFWTLVANAEKLSKQFKHENIKYVPKFFAAAIVGENPKDFGSNLQPLSTYTK